MFKFRIFPNYHFATVDKAWPARKMIFVRKPSCVSEGKMGFSKANNKTQVFASFLFDGEVCVFPNSSPTTWSFVFAPSLQKLGGTIQGDRCRSLRTEKRGTKNKKEKWVVPGLIPCETSALCGSYPALSATNPLEKNEKKQKEEEGASSTQQSNRPWPARRAGWRY